MYLGFDSHYINCIIQTYSHVTPVGTNIPIYVQPFPVDESVTTEDNIEWAVTRLCNHRSGGALGMRAEHLKRWLATTQKSEKDVTTTTARAGTKDNRGTTSVQPATEPTEVVNWTMVVDLVQSAFQEGNLAEEATGQAVVIIPNVKKYYRGIGLVEVMWKVVVAILNLRIMASITLHDILHDFWASRGTVTAIIDAKLFQQLAALREEVLYVIFLDMHKAYDALDRSKCLEILEGYDVGPQAMRLLQTYWRRLTMVARAGGYCGIAFKGECGVTQGDPISPTILNVVADAVVRHWVMWVIADMEEQDKLGKEGRN